MKDAVESRIDLTYPRKDGSTLYDHYMHIYRTTGKRDSLLDRAIPPVYYEDVWDYYWDIHRGENGFSCSEALAYKILTGVDIGAYEMSVLVFIDNCVSNRLQFHRKS